MNNRPILMFHGAWFFGISKEAMRLMRGLFIKCGYPEELITIYSPHKTALELYGIINNKFMPIVIGHSLGGIKVTDMLLEASALPSGKKIASQTFVIDSKTFDKNTPRAGGDFYYYYSGGSIFGGNYPHDPPAVNKRYLYFSCTHLSILDKAFPDIWQRIKEWGIK